MTKSRRAKQAASRAKRRTERHQLYGGPTGPRGIEEEASIVVRRFAEMGPSRKVLYCRATTIPKVRYPDAVAAQNAARELRSHASRGCLPDVTQAGAERSAQRGGHRVGWAARTPAWREIQWPAAGTRGGGFGE